MEKKKRYLLKVWVGLLREFLDSDEYEGCEVDYFIHPYTRNLVVSFKRHAYAYDVVLDQEAVRLYEDWGESHYHGWAISPDGIIYIGTEQNAACPLLRRIAETVREELTALAE